MYALNRNIIIAYKGQLNTLDAAVGIYTLYSNEFQT